MHYQTYSDILLPSLKKDALIYDIVLILGASVLIALSAQIAIPVPFSPVPITGQTLIVLLTGALIKNGLAGISFKDDGEALKFILRE